MLWTILVGNGLYAMAVWGFWLAVDGDRAKFVPAFIFASITFFAGIATGIVASQTKKHKPTKRKPTKRMNRAPRVTADAFETIVDDSVSIENDAG
jgi:hypothetical protein